MAKVFIEGSMAIAEGAALCRPGDSRLIAGRVFLTRQ